MQPLTELSYGDHPRQKIDFYRPETLIDGYRTVIHFHGGGLTAGSKAPHLYIDNHVAFGYVFFDCNYRFRNEVSLEEVLVDAANAVRASIDAMPTEKKHGKIFIAGDSAGGYIAMMLAFRRDLLENAGVAPTMIGGYVFDDPMYLYGFDEFAARFAEKKAFITDLLTIPNCPLSHIEENYPYPPMFIMTYGKGIPTFPAFTHLFVGTMLRYGYIDRVRFEYYPDYPHGGNFVAPPVDGIVPYSARAHEFYRSIKD